MEKNQAVRRHLNQFTKVLLRRKRPSYILSEVLFSGEAEISPFVKEKIKDFFKGGSFTPAEEIISRLKSNVFGFSAKEKKIVFEALDLLAQIPNGQKSLMLLPPDFSIRRGKINGKKTAAQENGEEAPFVGSYMPGDNLLKLYADCFSENFENGVSATEFIAETIVHEVGHYYQYNMNMMPMTFMMDTFSYKRALIVFEAQTNALDFETGRQLYMLRCQKNGESSAKPCSVYDMEYRNNEKELAVAGYAGNHLKKAAAHKTLAQFIERYISEDREFRTRKNSIRSFYKNRLYSFDMGYKDFSPDECRNLLKEEKAGLYQNIRHYPEKEAAYFFHYFLKQQAEIFSPFMDLKKLQKVCNEVAYSFSIPAEIEEKFEKSFFLFEEKQPQPAVKIQSDEMPEGEGDSSREREKEDKDSKQKGLSVSSAAKTARTVQATDKNKDFALKLLVLKNKQNSR